VADKPKTDSGRKRVVKNPETFREKALKANENNDKPKRSLKVRQASGKVASPVFGPIGRGMKIIFNRKPFRFIGKILFPVYLRNSFRELKLVEWPKWKTARDLTFAVLAFATVFGAAIALVDYGLDKLFRDILLK
jgi:preprotein translocase SecE subunit